VQEVFPVAMGAVIGIAVQSLAASRLRIPLMAALSVLAGVAAAALAGEIEVSPAFILVDIGQVMIVAALAMAATAMWQRSVRRSS
jgi:hypothetical protein